MEYKLKLLPVAYQDLRKAKNWYLGINPKLGEDFKLKINETLEYIQQSPNHYQKKHNNLRLAIVTRFPYTVYYLIEENLKMIVVFGILSQKQNPDKINKRLNK